MGAHRDTQAERDPELSLEAPTGRGVAVGASVVAHDERNSSAAHAPRLASNRLSVTIAICTYDCAERLRVKPGDPSAPKTTLLTDTSSTDDTVAHTI
jgi:hypothetical protein